MNKQLKTVYFGVLGLDPSPAANGRRTVLSLLEVAFLFCSFLLCLGDTIVRFPSGDT